MSLSDVIVVGGGCAGLFTALELGERGYSCVVLDSSPLGRFASTRNQGWIHSGSLYAGLNQPSVADHCAKGNARLRSLCADAVQDAIEAYYVFENQDEGRDFAQAIHKCGIAVDEIDLVDAMRDVPILSGSQRVAAVLRVQDHPFDTAEVLARLLPELESRGVVTVPVDPLAAPSLEPPSKRRSEWEVKWGAFAGAARSVILASGATIPALLAHVGSTLASRFYVEKIEVLTLHKVVSSAIVATPLSRRAPSIVPFSVNGTSGTTICLGKDDIRVASHTDRMPRAEAIKRIPRQLYDWFPSLDVALGERVEADLFCCQKLKRDDDEEVEIHRGHYLVDHAAQDQSRLDGLYTFYPGKFTAAPHVAVECAELVATRLGGPTHAATVPGTIGHVVAQQRFLQAGTYQFARSPNSFQLI